MGDVISIHSRRIFSREDALNLLPTIKRITERAAFVLDDLKGRLSLAPSGEALSERLRQDVDLVIRRWAIKISHLGCEPRGVWLVDFDTGDGWLSWRLGDESLSYFHPHGESVDEHRIPPLDKLPT